MSASKIMQSAASVVLLLSLALSWLHGPVADGLVLAGLIALALLRMTGPASGRSALGISLVLTFGGYACLQWGLMVPPAAAGICLLTGLGWLTHWFPLPRLPREYRDCSLWQLACGYVVPMLFVPVAMDQLLPRFVGHDEILAILMPAAVFPLFLAAVRMHSTRSIKELLAYSAVIPVCAGMATLSLSLWDLEHQSPSLTLSSAVPLFSGREILQWNLITVAGSWVCLAAGVKLREKHVGSVSGRLLQVLGVLSLIGIPPFPGYWWRLALLSALTIPHSRSKLTWLYEVVPGNFLFAGLLTAGFLFVMIPWLRYLRNQAESVRSSHS